MLNYNSDSLYLDWGLSFFISGKFSVVNRCSWWIDHTLGNEAVEVSTEEMYHMDMTQFTYSFYHRWIFG